MKYNYFNESIDGQNYIIEMANIRKDNSGLPMNLYVSPSPIPKHIPRLKVQQNYSNLFDSKRLVSVSISKQPKLLNGKWRLTTDDWNQLVQFINANYDLLISIWERDSALAQQNLKQSFIKIK